MKIITSFYRTRRPVFAGNTWHILPYIQLLYRADEFLETGVYTKAVTLTFGWLKWSWVCVIQEGY